MRRLAVVIAGLALACAGVAWGQDPPAENSDELLDSGARYEWQKPRDVMRLLSIRQAERVAEIGAGKGFFSKQIAVRVGEPGGLWVVETDPRLLAALTDLVPRFEPDTVVIDASSGRLELPEELDMVFTSNTWHHVPDRKAWLAEVGKALKPGGRFVILDWHARETPVGPPVDHRLAKKALLSEMRAAGWTLTSEVRNLEYQYFLIFTPPKG